MLLRAVLASLARRVLDDAGVRHLHAGAIHVDLAARNVTVAGTVVRLSALA